MHQYTNEMNYIVSIFYSWNKQLNLNLTVTFPDSYTRFLPDAKYALYSFTDSLYSLASNIYRPSVIGNKYNYLSRFSQSDNATFAYDRFIECVSRKIVIQNEIGVDVVSATTLGFNNIHNCLDIKVSSVYGLIHYTHNNLLSFAIFILTIYLMRNWSNTVSSILYYLLYYLLSGKIVPFIIILFTAIGLCNGEVMEYTKTETVTFITLATLGSSVYLTLGTFFDFYSFKWVNDGSIKFRTRSNTSFNPYSWFMYNITAFKSRTILGLIYLLYIISGVFSTNGVWYLLQSSRFISDNNLILGVATGLSTIVFSYAWYKLRKNLVNASFSSLLINSVFRSVMELASFNSVAISTYSVWIIWSNNPYLFNNNIIALLGGLLLNLPFSYLTINSEISLVSTPFYGLYYYLSFLGIAISTNGAYALLSSSFEPSYVLITVILGGSIITVILYPNFYRNYPSYNMPNPPVYSNYYLLWLISNNVIRYYFLVLSYVILNQLIFNFIG